MWTCPVCKRNFKRKEQPHSCGLIDTASLFVNKPPQLKKLFDLIVKKISGLGEMKQETVKAGVLFRHHSAFFGIKIKKDHLLLEYFLDRVEDDPPVNKTLNVSAKRIVHYVSVDEPEDVTPQLIAFIKESYGLTVK